MPERPDGRKFEEHRKGTTYQAPSQKAWDLFRSLRRQWAHRNQSKNRWPFSWRSHRTHFRAQPISGPKDCSREEANLTRKGRRFGGQQAGGTGSRAGPRLTCVCLDRPISRGTDNVCKKATLVQRETHLVRFQAYRSVELGTDTRHKCWYQSSTDI